MIKGYLLLPVSCLLSVSCLLATDSMRLISFEGGVARVGVSTDKLQFTIRSSLDRTNWIDRGTTWIVRGGTNEVIVAVPLPPSATSTFLSVR